MSSKSRVIVKSIPKYATEEMVKKHFAKLPGVTITDVKVMRTEAGQSRRFCFIGFTSEGEALRAVEYFNRTFFDTCKMDVSVALEVGSTALPKAWSKHSKKEAPKAAPATAVPVKRTDNEQRVSEFMAAIEAAPKKPMVWENDDDDADAVQIKATKKDVNGDESDDYDENYKVQQQQTDSEVEEEVTKEDVKEDEKLITEEKAMEDVDDKRLFVRNLPFSCTKEDLEGLFSPYGAVDQIHIPLSRESKFPKGIAFVSFEDSPSALAAYENIDGSIFQGRLIHVMPAKKQQQLPSGDADAKSNEKLDSREAKKQKTKEAAPHKALFLQESNVAGSMAAQLGISKESVLDGSESSGSLAVRVAVAEASMVASQKKYLEDAGVDLAVLEATEPGKNSDTCLFCKNLPAGVQEEELARTLGKYGKLSRLVFTRNSSLAICEYVDASEARKAYRSLLGSNFHSQPLLLSWAPKGIFKDDDTGSSAAAPIIKSKPTTSAPQELAASFCLFVKNLSFHTTEDGLKELFIREAGKVRSVKIPKKKKNINANALQSMGFGFVEFETNEACKLAMDKLQGAVLDGHQLELSYSNPKTESAPATKSKTTVSKPPSSKATRLLVKNVPFEATEKEVRELFASFVQIKKVRLPKKFGGQHRGFAFVDCATHQEACDAFSLLGSTHLYGRHLVIEWALDQGATLPSNDDELMIYE